MLVSQAHPQVIVFMQQHFLHAGVSNPTGLIPEEQQQYCPHSRDFTSTYNSKLILRFVIYLLVDVVIDGEQVITHGLEGELMQHR